MAARAIALSGPALVASVRRTSVCSSPSQQSRKLLTTAIRPLLHPSGVKPFRGGQCFARPAVRCLAMASVVESTYSLKDGVRIEVIKQAAQGDSEAEKPPLVFIHGSYHAAWCYQENFAEYFSAAGYDSYSISLRAQGGSDPMPEATVAGTVASHAEDIADFVSSLTHPPVVVAHSFGGLPLHWYVNKMKDPSGGGEGYPPLAGIVFLASVPPSGNKGIIGRLLFKKPILSFKITWWFIRKSFATSAEACRTSFFSADVPQEKIERYMDKFANGSKTRLIDLKNMNEIVPLSRPPPFAPPALVMGATDDQVVDVVAVEELAQHYGVQPVIMEGMAHDMMLDTKWKDAAQAINIWLEKTLVTR